MRLSKPAFLLVLWPTISMSAPSLDIRHAPVGPVINGPSGPASDPQSQQGQWFQNLITGQSEARTHEFYDNRFRQGGSRQIGTKAISGHLNFIDLNTGQFGILARITNDNDKGVGNFRNGRNDAGERWRGGANDRYSGTLFGVKLSTEFARSEAGVNARLTIVAEGYDQLGWYSNGDTGSFQVPTFDFGDIAPGETKEKQLTFAVAGIDSAVKNRLMRQLNQYLDTSSNGELAFLKDIFLNRTSSLKISDFPEGLRLFRDNGGAYPGGSRAQHASNVSVFHNTVPIPAAIWFLGSGLLGLLGFARVRNESNE